MINNSNTGAPTGDKDALLSRRSLFQRAGLLLAAAAIPPLPGAAEPVAEPSSPAAAEGISPAMEKLSAYMSAAADRALPDETVEKAKQHTLDTLAAMVSGSDLAAGQAALKFAREYGGKEVSTVVASNIVCGPIEAALTNGMLAHSDETDDSHAPSQSHPGCAVVPAALAAGREVWHRRNAVPAGGDPGL